MVTLRTTTLLVLILTVFNLNAQTPVAGTVSGTWEVSGNPYIVKGDLFIDPDERLTIKPGVQVLFAGNYSFNISGRLDANGSENENILFTLLDTTGFAVGQTGWKGISYMGYSSSTSENSNLDNCIIEYSAESGVSCINYAHLLINNTIIRNNKNNGLNLFEFSDISINGIEIYGNGTGGMNINFSSPQLSDFIIENNDGPGIALNGMSFNPNLPVFEHGEIRHNHTEMFGGGIYIGMDYYLELSDVNILHNTSLKGGGIYSGKGILEMKNVNLQYNSAENGGGMFINYGSKVQMEFTVVADNSAAFDGGGIYLVESELEVSRSTISKNEAGEIAGGIYYDVDFAQAGNISSSIIWGNLPEEVYLPSVNPSINFSNVGGGFVGIHNIDEDPLFISSETGDYHLSWANYPATNYTMSPCIDAGDPSLAPDPDATTADMGAYYFYQGVVTKIEDRNSDQFTIYPNPATTSFHINGTTGMHSLQIMSLSGQIVKEMTGGSLSNRINISDLNSGIYIVRVSWEQRNVWTEKLIIE